MVNIKRTEERTMIHDILIIDFRDSTDTTEDTIVSSAFSKI